MVTIMITSWFSPDSIPTGPVVIVDPGIANQNGYAPYDQGLQDNAFIKVRPIIYDDVMMMSW